MEKNKLLGSLLIKKIARKIVLVSVILLQMQLCAQTVATFAGSGKAAFSDGTGTAASFYIAYGVAIDNNTGNVYVADAGNYRIRKITPAGVVTTIAGSNNSVSLDGIGTAASFQDPRAIAIDGAGNLYVVDRNRIRKITSAGKVTTIAGSQFAGNVDGIGEEASLYFPQGIAVDDSGNIYVTEESHTIRKITPSGVVTTIAGTQNIGKADGNGLSASFNSPKGIAVDKGGNLYVSDRNNHKIRKITSTGNVTTFAGSGLIGGENGIGTNATFSYPDALSIDGSGNLYVFDGNYKIRKITPSGQVSTLAGSGIVGIVDGSASTAQFDYISGIASNKSGDEVYLSEYTNHTIRRILSCSSSLPSTPLATVVQPTMATPYGSITVTEPIGDFEYSIDNKNFQSSPIFTGVQQGSVQVVARKKAAIGCISLPATFIINKFLLQPMATSSRVSAGGSHSLSICENGTVRSWGNNDYGKLGTGDETYSNVPVTVKSLDGIISVVAALTYSLALKNDGTVWAWGSNTYGELGNGSSNKSSNVPVQVTGLTDVIAIDGNRNASIALKKDGTVWTWGWNNLGLLGNGGSSDSNIPIQVNSLTKIVAISASDAHRLALQDDGTVWSWGVNGYGQLGDGPQGMFNEYLSSKVPVKVRFLTGITAISAGRSHSTALKYDGTVWNWGWNLFGQLGNGTNVQFSGDPVQVSSLTNIIAIDDGEDNLLALKNDGTVWSWGKNSSGLIGDGTTIDRRIPVQVSALKDVKTIDAGFGLHCLAVKKDDTLWAWGDNNYGSFGTGDRLDSFTPIQVPSVCNGSLATTEESFAENTITVYPNPSKGIIQVIVNSLEFTDGKLEIYDTLGKKVYVASSIKQHTQLNLSSLSKGIYFIKIYNGTNIYNKKIFIE